MRRVMLSLVVSVPMVFGSGHNSPRPSITGLRIHLFCDATGQFTDDVTAIPNLDKWDPTTGGGGAPCASSAVMLVWAVQGEPGVYYGDWNLRYHVRRERRAEAERGDPDEGTIRLGTADGAGSLFVPLLLHDTGCDLVRVGVMIGNAPPAHETILPFHCIRVT